MTKEKFRDDRFTWKAGDVEFTPPSKEQQKQTLRELEEKGIEEFEKQFEEEE